MDYKKDFNAFAGGKIGVFKGVKITRKECLAKNIQNLVSIKPNDEVTVLSWGDDNEKEILIGSGTKEVRNVRLYDTESSSFATSFGCEIGTGKINGLSRHNGAILTAVESGEINLRKSNEDDETLFNAGADLHRMRLSNIEKNIIATGGKEHKLKLFDLNTKKQIFIEKNLPHDSLELRVPIWITDLAFLPETNHVVTCGRYGHIRLYDPSVQRRPVIKLEMKDEALSCLGLTPNSRQIVVGSGRGKMNLIDLRKGKVLNTYKGFSGAVTGIACSEIKPYVVSVSIDRHLRVHDLNTKKLVQKFYMKSKLSTLLIRRDFSLEKEEEESDEELYKDCNIIYDDDNDNKITARNTKE